MTRATANCTPEVLLGLAASVSPPLTVTGDSERLRLAFEQCFSLVWRSLRRFGVAEARVDDALQLVFLAFSARLPEIAPGAERSFLLSTTVRIAANVRRLALRSREIPSEDLDNAEPKPHTPEELLDWKQRREALDRALDALPLEQRAVFVLFELEGLTLPEIAESLGIRLGTATSRLRRARARFEGLANAFESSEEANRE